MFVGREILSNLEIDKRLSLAKLAGIATHLQALLYIYLSVSDVIFKEYVYMFVSRNRGYPAKRALSAMRKHGG